MGGRAQCVTTTQNKIFLYSLFTPQWGKTTLSNDNSNFNKIKNVTQPKM